MLYDNTNCSIASYAVGNTPYRSDLSLNIVIKKLETYNRQPPEIGSRELHES